jgi:hypothetical protein
VSGGELGDKIAFSVPGTRAVVVGTSLRRKGGGPRMRSAPRGWTWTSCCWALRGRGAQSTGSASRQPPPPLPEADSTDSRLMDLEGILRAPDLGLAFGCQRERRGEERREGAAWPWPWPAPFREARGAGEKKAVLTRPRPPQIYQQQPPPVGARWAGGPRLSCEPLLFFSPAFLSCCFFLYIYVSADEEMCVPEQKYHSRFCRSRLACCLEHVA